MVLSSDAAFVIPGDVTMNASSVCCCASSLPRQHILRNGASQCHKFPRGQRYASRIELSPKSGAQAAAVSSGHDEGADLASSVLRFTLRLGPVVGAGTARGSDRLVL
jgi:hypothetical protein